jgi:hypothetical protein
VNGWNQRTRFDFNRLCPKLFVGGSTISGFPSESLMSKQPGPAVRTHQLLSPSVVLRTSIGCLVGAAAVAGLGVASPTAQAQSSNTAPPLTAPTVPPSATVPRATPSPTPRAPRTTRRRVKTTARVRPKTTAKTTATTAPSTEPSTGTSKIIRATVVGAGDTGLAVRETAAVTGKLMSRKPEGTIMRIACEVQGESVKDNVSSRASTVWIKLVAGGYVSSIYTSAFEAGEVGSGDRKLLACNADGTVPSTIPVTPETTKKPAGSSGSSTATTAPANKGAVPAKTVVSSVDPG